MKNIKVRYDDLLKESIENFDFNNIKIAIEGGANVHMLSEYSLRRIIETAVTLFNNKPNEAYNIVKYLLEHGADPHINDEHIFRYASMVGLFDIVKLLINYNVNIHVDNDVALYLAIKYKHYNIVYLLFGHGAQLCDEDRLNFNDEDTIIIKTILRKFKFKKLLK